MNKLNHLSIRPATIADVPLLKTFLHELAEYERLPNAVLTTEDSLAKDGFGPSPKFRALIADWDAQPVGYAVIYDCYSTWRGPGIFLEDLFVRQPFRGRGIGKALLSRVARIAREEGSYGLRWEVLDWNEPAIQFYKSLGATFRDEWRQVLLDTPALHLLAD
ncbi:MAG: GNAT family N-acetyltransferase [Candidatus Acidiferrum sp.]